MAKCKNCGRYVSSSLIQYVRHMDTCKGKPKESEINKYPGKLITGADVAEIIEAMSKHNML